MTNTPPPDDNEGSDPYQGMPSFPGGGAQEPANVPQQPTQPSSIRNAVRLMWLGAALAAIGLLISLVTAGSVRDQAREEVLKQQPNADQATIDAAVNTSYALGIVISILVILCWLWMAWKNGQGRNWARILSTVLGCLAVVFTLIGLFAAGAVGGAAGGGTFGTISNIIQLIIAIAILIFIWRPESTQFYKDSEAAKNANKMR